MHLDTPDSWAEPVHTATAHTSRYGQAAIAVWHRLHPRLARRGPWTDHPGGPFGELPVIEGTLIRLTVDHLPRHGQPDPIWLWCSHPTLADDRDDDRGTGAAAIEHAWRAYLRRFDLEHTFRYLKQHLGWTRPKLRDPAAADRWTWLVLIAYTQLRLARTLTDDLRHPWERPLDPDRLTPTRVRRGFPYLQPKIANPASAPKFSRPGPGRPPGTPNRHPAPRYRTGKLAETA
jgi:hypothetical protein